jgi:hypothetical protein
MATVQRTLTANKKFRYGTRVIAPGDKFQVNDRQARLLIGIGNATMYVEREPAKVGAPAEPTPAGDSDYLESLREQARSAGLKVDNRWGEQRLKKELRDVERGGPASSAGRPPDEVNEPPKTEPEEDDDGVEDDDFEEDDDDKDDAES